MLDRSVNSSWALLSHSMLFIAHCHSAVFSHTPGWPDLSFQRLLQGISFPFRSCTCIVLMLLYLSENTFHCQSLPSPSSASPSLWNAGVLCYSVVAGTCLQLLHRWEFTEKSWGLVPWHSFILRWVLSLTLGLGIAKWCCPLPQYGISISKVHLNKEVQETLWKAKSHVPLQTQSKASIQLPPKCDFFFLCPLLSSKNYNCRYVSIVPGEQC